MRPHPVEVRLGGELRAGVGQVVDPSHPASAAAREAYLRRRRVPIRPADRLLLIDI